MGRATESFAISPASVGAFQSAPVLNRNFRRIQYVSFKTEFFGPVNYILRTTDLFNFLYGNILFHSVKTTFTSFTSHSDSIFSRISSLIAAAN